MTPAETYKEVVSLLREGRNIDAGKLLRVSYGLTVREAFDLVNEISLNLKPKKL